MALEADLTTVLKSVTAKVYPRRAPAPIPPRPFVTYTKAGGEVVNYIDSTLPGTRNVRIQVNVWCDTELAAGALAAQVEDAMRQATLFDARPIGAAAAIDADDPTLVLFGLRQDYTCWYQT